MIHPQLSMHTTFRYSPLPIDGYQRVLGGKSFGPANSKLLVLPQVWNLAYLSFPYEDLMDHPDPIFTTNVRRTTQMHLNAKGLGLSEDPQTLVGLLLNLPAPRFVRILEESPELLATLPLFQVYGQEWINTISRRAKGCEWESVSYAPRISVEAEDIYCRLIARVNQ